MKYIDETDKEKTFDLPSSNLIICAGELNMKNYIYNEALNNDCSNICFEKNIKIDITNNECVRSCKEKGYNYEYNNICYNECPEGTHVIIKNISNKDNVYNEYYNGVAICLDKNPEGYYLSEDGFYQKCFESCKYCLGPGNEINNNCTECKNNFLFIEDYTYGNNCFEKCPYYFYFNESNNYFCTEVKNCTGYYDKLIIKKRFP